MGEGWGQGPGPRPVLKHLLEVSGSRIRKPWLGLRQESAFSPWCLETSLECCDQSLLGVLGWPSLPLAVSPPPAETLSPREPGQHHEDRNTIRLAMSQHRSPVPDPLVLQGDPEQPRLGPPGPRPLLLSQRLPVSTGQVPGRERE